MYIRRMYYTVSIIRPGRLGLLEVEIESAGCSNRDFSSFPCTGTPRFTLIMWGLKKTEGKNTLIEVT